MDKWRDYSKELGFVKTEDSEKDYLQELLLYWLFSSKISDSLTFRGGTAISKLYGSNRFSEDLDFILSKGMETNIVNKVIIDSIKKVRTLYQTEYSVVHYRNMLKYILKIKGPLYNISRNEQAKQTLSIDMDLYERPLLNIKRLYRLPIYEDLRPYSMNTLLSKELLADKIKAMFERVQPVARDLYDVWLLSKKYRIKPDLDLVSKKMKEYGKTNEEVFCINELRKKVKSIKDIWKKELSRLMYVVPEYKDVSSEFLGLLKSE